MSKVSAASPATIQGSAASGGKTPLGDPLQTSVARSSVIMAVGTLLSRILGFVRWSLLIVAIGALAANDAFQVANNMPNMVYNLLAAGVLDAILVPQIVRAFKTSSGSDYVNRLITLVGLILFGITALMLLGAAVLVNIFAAQMAPAWKSLAIVFSIWCLPQIFFYGLYNLLGETLNARGIFGPYTWAPVVNNVIGIVGLLVFIMVYGTATDVNDPTIWNTSRTALLAGPATLGVVIQALILLPPLRHAGIHIRPDFRFRGAGLRSASKVAGWVFAVLTVNQISVLSTMNIGAAANNWREVTGIFAPSITAINFTYMIYMMPQSIIATSISIAIFTRIASAVADGQLQRVKDDFHFGVRTTTVLNLWSAAILGAGAIPIFQALAANSSRVEISYTALALVMMLPGLAAAAIVMFGQRVFFAFEDGRPVFYTVLLPTLLFVAVSWILKANLPGYLWVIAVLAAEAVSRLGQAGISLHLVAKRLPGVRKGQVVRDTVLYSIFALLAGSAAVGVLHLVGPFAPGERYFVKFLGAAWRGVVVVVVVTVVYLLLMAVFDRRGFESVVRTLGNRIPLFSKVAALLPALPAVETDSAAEVEFTYVDFFPEGANPDSAIWFSDRLAKRSRFRPHLGKPLLTAEQSPAARSLNEQVKMVLYRFSLIFQPAPLKHAGSLPAEFTAVSEPVKETSISKPGLRKLPARKRISFDEPAEFNSLLAPAPDPDVPENHTAAQPALEDETNSSSTAIPNRGLFNGFNRGKQTLTESIEFAKETVDTLQAGEKVDPTKPTLMLFGAITVLSFVLALATLGLMPTGSFLDNTQPSPSQQSLQNPKPAASAKNEKEQPSPASEPVPLPTAAPVITDAEVISWQNDGGDLTGEAKVIYDNNPETLWVTRYYAVSELPAGDTIRLVLKLKEPAQVKELNLTGLMKGGQVEVFVGNSADKLFTGQGLASAALESATVITLPEATAGSFIGVNFKALPVDDTGAFRIKLKDLSVK